LLKITQAMQAAEVSSISDILKIKYKNKAQKTKNKCRRILDEEVERLMEEHKDTIVQMEEKLRNKRLKLTKMKEK